MQKYVCVYQKILVSNELTTERPSDSDNKNSTEPTDNPITSDTTTQKTDTKTYSVDSTLTDNSTDSVDTNDTNTPTEEPQPATPYDVVAKEGTEELLAERIIYYINKYREEEGNVTTTVLPGLTELCQYRSRQLVTNYSHDTQDIRAAATDLQYGRYVDPRASGYDVDPYYSPMAQEAINRCTAICVYTVDQMAKRVVDSFRDSQGHWSYLGAATNSYANCKYIAAGATYSSGTWYVCVCVTDTDVYG